MWRYGNEPQFPVSRLRPVSCKKFGTSFAFPQSGGELLTRAQLCLFLLIFICMEGLDAAAQCSGTTVKDQTAAGCYSLTGLSTPTSFSISDQGAATYDTSGTGSGLTVGYAQVQANAGSTTAAGYLIISLKDNGVLVSEVTVPAVLPITSGRIYADNAGPGRTGIAMVNPNSTDAVVSFYFTPGSLFCDCPNPSVGSFTLPAHSQIASFVNEAPFNSLYIFNPAMGTLTFSSNVPIAVIALHGRTNERGEFLMTTLPVADLSEPASSDEAFIPQYAAGGGWATEVILVNKTDASIGGTIQFLGLGGTTTRYSIPPRNMFSTFTSGAGSATTVGAIRITPDAGTAAAAGLAIFSFSNGGVTVSEAGVPALRPGQSFRMFEIESGSYPGQLQTGLAIANPSSTDAAIVTLTLTNLAGDSTGMTSTLTLPPLGHTAAFMKQFPGLESIPYPFQGVVRISTTSPSGVAVIGLRGNYNELKDFLITTSMPVNEATPLSPVEPVFPHFADGNGYKTEFILFSGSAGLASSGNLQFFSQSGAPLN